MADSKAQKFHSYFNSFYSPLGIYPVRYVKKGEIYAAIKALKEKYPDHDFEGDTVDREFIRDIIFTTEEINQAYSKA